MREKVLVLFLLLSFLVVIKVEGFDPYSSSSLAEREQLDKKFNREADPGRLNPLSPGPKSSIEIVTPNKKAELEIEKPKAKEVEEVKKIKEEKANNDLIFIIIAGIVVGGLFFKFPKKKKKRKKTK